jgi:hypothetical protein
VNANEASVQKIIEDFYPGKALYAAAHIFFVTSNVTFG